MTSSLLQSVDRIAATAPGESDVFDDSAIGMAFISYDERVLRVNPALLSLFGLKADHLLGTKWSDIQFNDVGKTAALIRHIRDGVTDHGELTMWYELPDGELLELRLAASRAEFGLEDAVLLQILDRTELASATASFFESERRFSAVAKFSSEAIVWLRVQPDVRVLFVSDAAIKLSGYSASEFHEMPNSQQRLIHPDDLHLLQEFAKSRKESDGVLLRWITRSGETKWIEQKMAVLAESNECVTEVIGVCRDVTDEFRFQDLMVADPPSESLRQLRAALVDGRIGAYLQPIIDINDGTVCGFEALARWQEEHGGFVSPDAFIPLAEESGDIFAIGEMILNQACAHLAELRAAGLGDDLTVEVNVSARQLEDEGLVGHVLDALARHSLPAENLCLELTESLAMNGDDRIIGHLQCLRDLGVQLAIDDFGTGYSNFAYLTQLPIDILKLDRSLVAGLGSDQRKVEVVRSVLTLARALDLKVIAEGVETEEERETLAELGCTLAQGFLWSTAVPFEDARSLLEIDVIPNEAPTESVVVLEALESSLLTANPTQLLDVSRATRGSESRVTPAASHFWKYVSVGLVMVAMYFINPRIGHLPAWLPRFPLYISVNASAVVALVYGIRKWKPVPVSPWWFMAFGQAVYTVGDFLYYWGRDISHSQQFPGIPDIFYLGRIPFIMIALAIIIRHRGEHNRSALLDSLVVGIAVGAISWVFLLRPYAEATLSASVRLTSLAYPVTDLMLLVLAIRLLAGDGRRVRSFYLLTGGLVLLAVTDSVYAWLNLHGVVYGSGSLIEGGWLLYYLIVGAGSLHPSMTELTSPTLNRDAPYSRLRLLALGVAALTCPVLLAVEFWLGKSDGDYPLILAAIVIICLIVMRLSQGMRIQRETDARMRYQAFHDSLTGVANRALFYDRIDHTVERSRRKGFGVAVLIIDLDGFKEINDTLGHAAGDTVLVEVAHRLVRCCRSEDTVARLGGDEFAILLEDTPSVGLVLALAQRIHSALAEPISLGADALRASGSIGISFSESGPVDVDAMMNEADVAMYEAKRDPSIGFKLFRALEMVPV
jgi:diguanylate cyclase (GGDEF)-like protein/PAS domain S-box-containing protein